MSKPYSDPILQKYIDLIKANCGDFKAFYQGEPVRIPNSSLPALLISKRQTQVGPLSNAEDGHQMGITITVIVDVRKDLSTEESIPAVTNGVATLYDIMEGRNEDYTLKDGSILDILRTNLLVDDVHQLRTDLDSVTRVDYGTTLRDRPAGEWYIEASVDFVCTFVQVR